MFSSSYCIVWVAAVRFSTPAASSGCVCARGPQVQFSFRHLHTQHCSGFCGDKDVDLTASSGLTVRRAALVSPCVERLSADSQQQRPRPVDMLPVCWQTRLLSLSFGNIILLPSVMSGWPRKAMVSFNRVR